MKNFTTKITWAILFRVIRTKEENMEENKRKKAPNLVLAIVCVTLIIFFAVLFAVCVISYNRSGNNNAKPVKKNTEPNRIERNVVQNDLEEETNEVVDANETEILEDESTEVEDEEAKVKAVIDSFVKAVNEEDWDEVAKLSSESEVNSIKEYNIKNLKVDTDELRENPNGVGYIAISDYDFDYQGLSAKDVGLGNLFCIDKINGDYVVVSIAATGP